MRQAEGWMQRSIIEEDVHQASLANFTNSSFPCFFLGGFFLGERAVASGYMFLGSQKKHVCE